MSSNAFARSRPRVRHQRVPRNNSCDHPRFLQLVNELARINDAKKKQEDASCEPMICNQSASTSELRSDATKSSLQDSCPQSSSVVSNNLCNQYPLLPHGIIERRSTTGPCCGLINGPHSSNGYRSLDITNHQSTSVLHRDFQHPSVPHNHRHSNPSHHSNQLLYQRQESQLISNTTSQDDRCPAKNSSASFCLNKSLASDQCCGSEFLSNHTDLRQDENRSKRKRVANESSSSCSRKNLTTPPNVSGTSKRLKSVSDSARPLSPSFTKCPICLLDCMDRNPSFTNNCFHLFCNACIENWTKNKATCPLCRTKFTKIIFNIKSATNYEEKLATPIRRDDDDGYIADRFMLEHLSSLNPNSVANRNQSSDEVQFLFENLRNSEVLDPNFILPTSNPRQSESFHSFNTVTTSTNFNSSVPHTQFAPTNYPIAPNYLPLIHTPDRIASTTNAAITSAYTTSNSMSGTNSYQNTRQVVRNARRSAYRNYEPTIILEQRVSRSSTNNTGLNQMMPLERHGHHQQHQHQGHHIQHHNLHQQHHNQQRTTLETISRLSQRVNPPPPIQVPYTIAAPPYNSAAYPRRYNPWQVEHQDLFDTLHRQMPDM